jgi:hypothetical protein
VWAAGRDGLERSYVLKAHGQCDEQGPDLGNQGQMASLNVQNTRCMIPSFDSQNRSA